MQANERKRILTLVENGTISAEEAIVLLEKLEKDTAKKEELPQSFTTTQEEPKDYTEPSHEYKSDETHYEESYTSSSDSTKKTTGFEDLFGKAFDSKEASQKAEEIVNELKKDLTEFGGRMATLLNTTFSKMKGFESDVPFGEKFEFSNHYAFDVSEVKGLDIDVPNGSVEFVKAEGDLVNVDVTVKTTLQDSEEKTRDAFLEDFIKLSDGKLSIATASKFSQVKLRVGLPEKEYDILFVRSLNSKVDLEDVQAKIIKFNLVNGSMNIRKAHFNHADLKTKNGSIETRFVKGEDLEAETVNGRIYIEGDLREVEGESLNGHVAITTTNEQAHKVKATTVAGSAEIYVPKTVAIDGKLTTNLGKIDLGLKDVTDYSTEDAILQKVTHFDKVLEGAPVLKLIGESRMGKVLVRYNP